jgi:hypothetical protein
VRLGGEAKDEWKCQWRTQTPDGGSKLLHEGIDHFEPVGTKAKTLVETASFFPTIRTSAINAFVNKVWHLKMS